MKFSIPLGIILVFSIAMLVVCGAAQAAIPTEVVVNKSLLLNLKTPAERVSIANPSIAELVLISPNQVQINGSKVGNTSLIVWEKGTGKQTFFDLSVKGDPGLLDTQLKDIAPNDSMSAQFVNETLVLSGKASNEQSRRKAEELGKIYSAKVLNLVTIDDPQQVLLQVKVAQVDKTSLKKLGISAMVKGSSGEGFSNLVGAPSGGAVRSTISSGNGFSSQEIGSGTGISGNVVGVGSFNPLDPFQIGVSYFPGGIGAVLQALSTKGLAKVLAEPNLLVKSGQEGKFHAGSEVPYTIVKSAGGIAATEIVFKKVGISLNFRPEVLDNGIINLKIDPAEVSSIAGTLAVNGYPIIDTRNVNTNVELRDGESLVLAGLIQEDHIRTMSKIPLLGDIPILGALFRSTQDDLTEKELVFFITPKIVKPAAPGAVPELPTDREPTPDEEKELRWMPIGE